MSMEGNLTSTPEEDKEPIYFAPKRVSMISDLASILSWIVLVGFIGSVIVEVISLQSQLSSQSLTIAGLIHEPSLYVFLFVNLIVPLLTGLGLFVLLQAAALGLNMLLENDFNARDAKSKAKA
jgi:hypothetical protein